MSLHEKGKKRNSTTEMVIELSLSARFWIANRFPKLLSQRHSFWVLEAMCHLLCAIPCTYTVQLHSNYIHEQCFIAFEVSTQPHLQYIHIHTYICSCGSKITVGCVHVHSWLAIAMQHQHSYSTAYTSVPGPTVSPAPMSASFMLL